MAEVILSEEQLQTKLKEWQKRLRLQDWIIKVRIARIHELQEGSMAQVRSTLLNKTAMILILDSNDYEPGLMLPQDMENSLVHELLHLHLEPIHLEDDSKQVAVEQAIECITSGLLAAHRENAILTSDGRKIYCD
jgi:hypothetical protein